MVLGRKKPAVVKGLHPRPLSWGPWGESSFLEVPTSLTSGGGQHYEMRSPAELEHFKMVNRLPTEQLRTQRVPKTDPPASLFVFNETYL